MFKQLFPLANILSSQVCLSCDAQCASGCTGGTASNCSNGEAGKCKSYEYKGDCLGFCPWTTYTDATSKTCIDCNDLCAGECTGPSASDCVLCAYYRNGQECVETCPTGTYADSHYTCRSCHPECEGPCIGPFSTQCCSSSDKKVTAQQCCRHGACAASCKHLQYGFECVASCPVNSYANDDGTACFDCHVECEAGCTGPLASDCADCKNYEYNGACVSTCPSVPATYADSLSMTCRVCLVYVTIIISSHTADVRTRVRASRLHWPARIRLQ